ncbi:phosphonoacetaldehyde hydrolase [Lacipirellula parvula]|uniref:Phosphonoacetaldehyde hydrolase n=1 Tax=Lacipirellula parvula TaxID=2650471 RepID=A0A5K7X8S9_9BACT|nr:phosphonoacetaldehyde hydrolase [Lacipirellula parvula]BBO32938.1 phosphonoacetaldehyde hydrolase [Lacipirellula parvula]
MSTLNTVRRHVGPLKAVVFDWAGTLLDYGSQAPVLAVVSVFRSFDVPVSIEEARGPMGMAKRDHLRTMLEMPRIAAAWQEIHRAPADEAAIDKLYARFLETQKTFLADHAQLIPGALEAVADCRRRGMRIGSTTGYIRELMEVIVPAARAQGLEVDAMYCASDFAEGRPAPWMSFENARTLGVYPMAAIVKVDDTIVGVEEGLNAGMWSVGLSVSGNMIGLNEAETAALPAAELAAKRRAAVERMEASGAHFVIDSVAELPQVLDQIEKLLAAGETP